MDLDHYEPADHVKPLGIFQRHAEVDVQTRDNHLAPTENSHPKKDLKEENRSVRIRLRLCSSLPPLYAFLVLRTTGDSYLPRFFRSKRLQIENSVVQLIQPSEAMADPILK